MHKNISLKRLFLGLAVLIIALVAVISPEHSETVAKAFMLLFGVYW